MDFTSITRCVHVPFGESDSLSVTQWEEILLLNHLWGQSWNFVRSDWAHQVSLAWGTKRLAHWAAPAILDGDVSAQRLGKDDLLGAGGWTSHPECVNPACCGDGWLWCSGFMLCSRTGEEALPRRDPVHEVGLLARGRCLWVESCRIRAWSCVGLTNVVSEQTCCICTSRFGALRYCMDMYCIVQFLSNWSDFGVSRQAQHNAELSPGS